MGNAEDESLWNQKAVIVVASLLFFVIFTLALIPLAKCAMRYIRWETQQEMENRLANTGLKHRVVHSFPIIIFERPSSDSVPASKLSPSSSSFSVPSPFSFPTECPICLTHFERGDRIRLMPSCFHGFHVNCIDTWLHGHSSCPLCRHCLLSYNVIP
ncbi:hypothetical protein KP509_21G071800 [Ceratopteris richardii]|nr:hypothetical protein KP509_21G071800 [Ceratopteris richardii]